MQVSRLFLFLFLPVVLSANPSGEKVVFGQAEVERPSSDTLHVVQTSPQAIIEWDRFSIEAHETTRFIQPSADATVLNRVTGSNLTEIYGKMESNGQVFLINPYGVVVGESGVINCAQFLAAALDLDNYAFLRGEELELNNGQDEAKVINRGSITAFGGPLYLVGSSVENEGSVQAAEDRIYMISGASSLTVSLDRPKLMIRPREKWNGDSALSPYVLAVNRDGMEDAHQVKRAGGRVFLEARSSPFLSVPDAPVRHVGSAVERTLDALQQLRSVIPERLWYQEFAWLIDEPGFQKVACDLADHRKSYAGTRAAIVLGRPEYYFLHATIAGEPIRIMDRYLEFINSPYWKNPNTLQRLYYLQHHYSKVPR